MKNADTIPDRDPAAIYGPMGNVAPPVFNPADWQKDPLGPEPLPGVPSENPYPTGTIASQRFEQECTAQDVAHIEKMNRADQKPPRQYSAAGPECEPWQGPGFLNQQKTAARPANHGPRVLTLSIHTDAEGGLNLSQEIKFDDLKSPTQSQAISDTLEELNCRLSAAININTSLRGYKYCSSCGAILKVVNHGWQCPECHFFLWA